MSDRIAGPQSPLMLEPWLIFLHNPELEAFRNPKDYNRAFRNPEKANRFSSLAEKRFYRFDNVVPLDSKSLGASNGWVLIERSSRQAPEKKSLFLVNPDHAIADAEHVKKVLVVIGSESDIPAGVIILLDQKSRWSHYILATIKCDAADRPWHHYRVTNYPEWFRYHDIVLYNRKPYSVVLTHGDNYYTQLTQVSAYTLDEQLKPHFAYQCAVEGTYTMSKDYPCFQIEPYLLESHGDLLLVKRYEDYTDDKYRKATFKYEVFILEMDDNNSLWRGMKLSSVGDQALFLGWDGCISVPVGKCPLFLENHIYFTNFSKSSKSCTGVYSLEFDTVELIPNLPASCYWQETDWMPLDVWKRRCIWFFPTRRTL